MMAVTVKSQRGASMFVVILLMAIFALIITVTIRVVPAYLEDRVVRNSMRGILAGQEASLLSLSEIRSRADRSFRMNGVDDFNVNNIRTLSQGGSNYIDINYEKRVHLFLNIDAVMTFEHSFER